MRIAESRLIPDPTREECEWWAAVPYGSEGGSRVDEKAAQTFCRLFGVERGGDRHSIGSNPAFFAGHGQGIGAADDLVAEPGRPFHQAW